MNIELFRCRQLCLLCHEITLNHYALCQQCEILLPPAQEYHIPIFKNIQKNIALFNYQFPFNQFITKLKFNHDLSYAKLLGLLFIKSIPSFYRNQSLPHAIIPVPLHVHRIKERGFNQALEIAYNVSRALHIPLLKYAALRITNTHAQSTLSLEKRQKNIKNAFVINQELPSHIVLLDDVVTTGHTLNELASAITQHQSGIKIDTWCCAKTDKH